MKTKPLTCLFVLATVIASAQTERYVTVTVQSPGQNTIVSNQVSIADGETGQVVNYVTRPNSQNSVSYSCFKDGIEFASAIPGYGEGIPSTVKGPAQFVLRAGNYSSGLLTIKIK